jgi:hypothetical protein
MSQERRERRNQKLGIKTSKRNWRRIALYAAAIVAVSGLVYYLVHRAQHKHDAFARCLTERGVKMYGAWWCPHCIEQKEKFDASFEYVPYVECGIKGNMHGQSQACKDAGVNHYPTWQFPPTGERVERVFTLEALSERTGCALE